MLWTWKCLLSQPYPSVAHRCACNFTPDGTFVCFHPRIVPRPSLFLLLLLCCCANSLRVSNPWSSSLLIIPTWRRRNEATYTFSFTARFVYTSPSKNMWNLKKKITLFFATRICLKGIFKSDIHWNIKYLINLNFKCQYDCTGGQNWTKAYHCHYELLTGEIELSHFRLISWDHGHEWTSFLCTV